MMKKEPCKIPDISSLKIQEGKTISLLSGEIIDKNICNSRYCSEGSLSKKRGREEFCPKWEEDFIRDFYFGNLNFDNYKDESLNIEAVQKKSSFFFMDDEITIFVVEKSISEISACVVEGNYNKIEIIINFLIKNITAHNCRNSMKKILTMIDENNLYYCFRNYGDYNMWFDFFSKGDWKLVLLFLSFKSGCIIFSTISAKMYYLAIRHNDEIFLNRRYEVNKYISHHKKDINLPKDFFNFAVDYTSPKERNIPNFNKLIKSYLHHLNIFEQNNPIFQEIYKMIVYSPDNFDVIINFIMKIDKYDERKIVFNIYKNNCLWIEGADYPKQIITPKQSKIIGKIIAKLCKNSNPFY